MLPLFSKSLAVNAIKCAAGVPRARQTLQARSIGLRTNFPGASNLRHSFPSRLSLPKRWSSTQLTPDEAHPSDYTLSSTLSPTQEALLNKEVKVLSELADILKSLDASEDDIKTVVSAVQQLEDLFLLVVVGEFNSGKSSFLNALMGNKFLEDGVTPTTSKIDILRYGEKFSVRERSSPGHEDQRIIRLPVDWLKEISLVDTPGTNAVYHIHQTITEQFVPRSDLVLWVTSADRAFSESERKFLETVDKYKKKIDMVESQEERAKIISFVKDQFKTNYGVSPMVFPVSSKKALMAKQAQEGENTLASDPLWIQSQFSAVENYVQESLGREERSYLKLMNPLGVSTHILQNYRTELQASEKVLQGDVDVLKRIETELEEYQKDMSSDFQYHLDRIDNVLLRLNERAREFIENKITLGNIRALISSETIQHQFVEEVVAESSTEVDHAVSEMVDWILKRNGKQWNAVIEYLNARTLSSSTQIVGKVRTQFDYNREVLIKDMGTSAHSVYKEFDKKKEAAKLSDAIRTSLYQTAALEFGAVGIGTILSSTLFDVTAILPASAIAITGLAVLPYTRRTLTTEVTNTTSELRSMMKRVLSEEFNTQVAEGVLKIKENIQPYSRFVHAESNRVSAGLQQLDRSHEDIVNLNEQITEAFHKQEE